MKDYERIFDWVEFDEGRARFSGGIRGVDECGHDTFAVETKGRVHYGEIDCTFLPDRNNFNIEIISFGYWDRGDVGGPMRQPIVGVFSDAEIKLIKRLIVGLISEASAWESKPSVMNESEKSRFMGKVFFREGWALVDASETEGAS